MLLASENGKLGKQYILLDGISEVIISPFDNSLIKRCLEVLATERLERLLKHIGEVFVGSLGTDGFAIR